MKKLLFFVLFLAFAANGLRAQWYLGNKIPDFYHPYRIILADTASQRNHPLDITRMVVDIRFKPKQGKVMGKVTHHFKPLRNEVDSVVLNAPGIDVKAVKVNDKIAQYHKSASDNYLVIRCKPALHWKSKGKIEIEYEATPRKGLYFIGWNSELRNQIWTQGQGIDNRHWIPMYDDQNDKMVTETIVTIDEAYSVLSNGQKLEEKSNGDGTKTWHYRLSHPHSNYLLMLGIGKYKVDQRETKDGLPVNLYYYPDWPETREPTYRHSVKMIEIFEDIINVPFPWESYSQIPVADFMYGAMENTTATLFGDFFMVDERSFHDRNYIHVNAHELAHQWFGDLVTARTHRDHWLQESFATFYPGFFFRETEGQARYQWMRRGWQKAGVKAEKNDRFPVVSSRAGRSRWYPQGAAVLGMMMYTFGEEQYHTAVQHYLEENAYQNVETRDLLNAFVDTLGINPSWFFDQWLYKGGIPHYQVDYEVFDNPEEKHGKSVLVDIRQTHKRSLQTDFFKMPLVVEVYFEDGSKMRKRKMVEGPSGQFRFNFDAGRRGKKQVAFVLFDPGSQVMKKVTFEKSLAELKKQARMAENMIDRYDAIDAMAQYPAEKTRDFLMKRFEQEDFDELLKRIGQVLAQNPNEAVHQFLAEQTAHEDVDVRKAVLKAVEEIPEAQLPAYEKLLEDQSYWLIRSALNKLLYQYPENAEKYLQQVEDVTGKSKSVEIARLGFQYHFNDDQAAAEKLAEYAGPDYEFITRRRAFKELKRQNYLSEKALANMVDAMLNPNGRLASDAKDKLKYFRDQMEYRYLIEQYYQERDWEDWQKPLVKLD